ncbi:hypothetical protein Tco_0551994 [Tanacetum coccineum]
MFGLAELHTQSIVFLKILLNETAMEIITVVCLQVVEAAWEVLLENFSSYEVHTYGLLGYLFANKHDSRSYSSFKGKTRIFLFHYNPSCVKGKVDFFFDDILDKLLQIARPSEVSKDTAGTTESYKILTDDCFVWPDVCVEGSTRVAWGSPITHSDTSRGQLGGVVEGADPYIGRSQPGYVFTSSIKQTMSATSSNHAKILAIHVASRECVWLRNVIQHIRESCGISSGKDAPTIVHEDNAACIA